MCINRDCKEYIVQPSAESMNRMASFLPVRAKAIKNLESQVFADSKAKKPKKEVTSLHTKDPESRKHEAKVSAQVQKLNTQNKLPTSLTLQAMSYVISSTPKHYDQNKFMIFLTSEKLALLLRNSTSTTTFLEHQVLNHLNTERHY